MKKIYQLGLTVALSALLPTGVLFAGDGDGKDKKNTITLESAAGAETITVFIATEDILKMGDIQIISKSAGCTVKETNPVLGGLQVVITMDPDPESHTDPNSSGGIIIEIVGVDNITGVEATDGNNGNNIPSNLVMNEDNKEVTNSTGNGQNNSTGLHANPVSNSGTNPTTIPSSIVPTSGGKKDINIFPNPVMQQTNVVTVGEILGKSIEIIDLSGHVVVTMIVPENSRQTVIDMSGLNPGLYILNYKTEDGRVISKKVQKI
jgi:hypothetical protein